MLTLHPNQTQCARKLKHFHAPIELWYCVRLLACHVQINVKVSHIHETRTDR